MPYVSDAQRRFAHSKSGQEKGFPTEEFDKASKGQKGLPEHVKGKGKPKGKKRPVKFGKPFGKPDDKY
jgi:hypothetical protein